MTSKWPKWRTSKYDNLRHFIADRPDPNFPGLKIGDKKSIQIIEGGGKSLDQYWKDYTKSHRSQHSSKVSSKLGDGEAQLSEKTNFNADELKAKFTPVDLTQQFYDANKAQSFKNFNVEGKDIKNQIDLHKQKTKIDIENAENNNMLEKEELREQVNQAERNKSGIGKAFSKKNPNVADNDSSSLLSIVAEAASLFIPVIRPLRAAITAAKPLQKLTKPTKLPLLPKPKK